MEAAAGAVKKPVKRKKRRMGSADFSLVALTCALVIFGVIMVFSASYYWSIDKVGNPYNFLIKDLFWAGTGFFIMIVTTSLDYHVYKKWAPWLMAGGLLLLTTHDVMALPLCDECYIIKNGVLVPFTYDGNPETLVKSL